MNFPLKAMMFLMMITIGIIITTSCTKVGDFRPYPTIIKALIQNEESGDTTPSPKRDNEYK